MPEHIIVETKPQHDLGRTIAKNTVFVTLGSIGLRVLNFLFSIYVVRRLGDNRFGQYATVLAFVGIFQILVELGMSQYVMREIARDHSKTQIFFGNLVALRFLLAILGIVVITLSAIALRYSSELVLAVFIYTFNYLFAAFLAPLQVVLTANEHLGYVSGLNVLGQIMFVILGAIFLFSGKGFTWLILAGLIGMPFQVALAAGMARRHHLMEYSFGIDPRTWPRLIWSGIPFGIISLALTITFSIDTVMLSKYQPAQVVGWYNVAYGLVFSLMFFFSGFKEAIVPSLSRTYAHDPSRVERWYHRSVKIILIISLPIATGGMLVAYPLIRLLYTATFLPSAVALQILIWDVPLLMFSAFCGNMTTIISEERAAARIYSINAVSNVVLNLYAIPHFGLLGAAFVTVITDLIGGLQFYFFLRRKLHLPDMRSVFARLVLAVSLMGVVVWLAGNLGLFLKVSLGVVVYGGLVFALQVLDKSEWSAIHGLLRKRSNRQPVEEAI
jgi:O-antigen/teichoic acid export membrane protein